MTTNKPEKPGIWSRHNTTSNETLSNETFVQAAKQHAIEPFLMSQKPRRTRAKKGKDNLLLRLFIVAHTLGAASFLMRLLMAIVVMLFGQTVSGHVVAKNAREGKTPTYTIEYSYAFDKRLFQGKSEVPQSEYDAPQTGDPIPVRVLKWSPAANSQIAFSGESRWSYVRSLTVPALLLSLVDGVFIYILCIAPALQRRLVANGLPTVARIVSVKKVKGGSITYEVKYEFAPVEYANAFVSNTFQAVPRTMGEEQKLQSQMTLSKEDGQNVGAGELVTVLFDANKPGRNLIYRFADYEVIV